MSVPHDSLSCETRQAVLVSVGFASTERHPLIPYTYSAEALAISGLSDPSKHFFVDDSLLNVRGSQALGWNSWLYDEQGTSAGKVKNGELSGVVSSLQGGLRAFLLKRGQSSCHVRADLRKEWSQFFMQP